MPSSPHTLEAHCAPRTPEQYHTVAAVREGIRMVEQRDRLSATGTEPMGAWSSQPDPGAQAACVHGMEDAGQQRRRPITSQRIGDIAGSFIGWGLLVLVVILLGVHLLAR